jgi:nucleoid-associated protein YgaU
MRKDAKLAFIVGGILISILVVYVLVVPGGQKKPKAVTFDDGGTNAKLVSHTTDAKTPVAEKQADKKVEEQKDEPKSDLAKNDPPKDDTAPTTKPTDPFASARAPEEDKWMLALNHGTVPMMTTSAPPVPAAKPIAAPTAPPKLEADNTASNVGSPVTTDNTQAPPVTIASNLTPTTPPQTPVLADPPPAPPAPSGMRTHVVKQGESIAKIAEAVYGSQNYWPYIIRANPGVVAEKIRPGMTLNLPPESEVKAGAPAKNPSTQPSGDTTAAHQAQATPIDPNTQYQVQSGDSLHKIAMKLYGNSNKWQAIYDLNKEAIGADPAKLRAKSVLKLPEAPTQK